MCNLKAISALLSTAQLGTVVAVVFLSIGIFSTGGFVAMFSSVTWTVASLGSLAVALLANGTATGMLAHCVIGAGGAFARFLRRTLLITIAALVTTSISIVASMIAPNSYLVTALLVSLITLGMSWIVAAAILRSLHDRRTDAPAETPTPGVIATVALGYIAGAMTIASVMAWVVYSNLVNTAAGLT
jgi:hypothetical protein